MAGASDLDHDIRYLLRLNELLLQFSQMQASIEEWRGKFTPSQQRAGLKAAFADVAEMSMRESRERVAGLDSILRAEGFPTLTELQLRHGRRIRRLLKAKSLKTEEDAIVLKGMMDSGLLTEEEVAIAWRLIEAFSP